MGCKFNAIYAGTVRAAMASRGGAGTCLLRSLPLPLPVAHVCALAQQPASSGPRDGGRKERETMTKQEPVSPRTAATQSRLRGAEVTQSVCPYCAIGCGLLVFTKAAKIIAIE